MRTAMTVAVLIALTPALSWADATKPQAKPVADASKPKIRVASSDPLICKKQETTGTRLGTKQVCYTADDWLKVNTYARDAVSHAQQQEVAPFSH